MREEDAAPRALEVPGDLDAALAADPAAAAAFRALAYSHQREYLQWLTEAKRDRTRVARIDRIVAALKAGRRER